MSTVLFEAPGPRTRARHRLYSIFGFVLVGGLALFVLWKMYAEGQFEYDLWEPFVTPAYVEAILLQGLWQTLQMAFLSIIFAVIFGLIFGIAKISDRPYVRWPAWLVVEFFRAVPLLLLMVFIFFSYGVGDGFGSYWSVVIALTLYNGSVLAEVFRAGLNAVPSGQGEAAYAVGMTKSQVIWIVQLPQAVKIMLPAIISQMVVALKDTSLGYYILAPGLTAIGKQVYTQFSNQFQTVIVIALLYIIANLILTFVATWVQKRFVGEKTISVPMVGEASADAGRGV